MRRVPLRGHDNILKRLLIHAGGLNLGLLMRTLCGVGRPRGLPGKRLGTSFARFRMIYYILTWFVSSIFSEKVKEEPNNEPAGEMKRLLIRSFFAYTHSRASEFT
jgi:hypothetical protein